MNVLNQEL